MASAGGVKSVASKAEMEAAVAKGAAFAHFWATWCEPSKQMDVVFAQLAIDYPHAQFLRIEAEEQPEIAELYDVSTVPFFLCIKDGAVVDTLEGANAPELAHKVAKTAGQVPASSMAASLPGSIGLNAGATVLGMAQESRTVGSNGKHAEEALSGTSNGNTTEAKDNGVDLTQRLKTLVNGKKVMLFMKGTPDEPRCGFSKKVVGALNETGVEYGTFNILSDADVRQGLKAFSNWPTYPQLYVNGELLGGCDIILEMSKSGELKQTFTDEGLLQPKKASLEERLQQLLKSSEVLLFMKGTPDAPRCGFSRKVVGALREDGVPFTSFDILGDEEVRQGLKTFSNWPTYPQLYHKGELVGGCDIIMEMKSGGELKTTLVS